ncbi:MAG: glycosyltransferase [Pseudomonadota bacterium]
MSAGANAPLRFSVIVASRCRPDWLKRCLFGLRQQDYPDFEIVLVADPDSIGRVDTSHIKQVPFDTPNLAEARNIGIAHAAGEVCAFIDDDAVPEPLWLRHLSRAFETTSCTAVVGFVRGRNGISFQSRLCSVDEETETHDEVCRRDDPHVPELTKGRAVKLVGTNMAFRRSAFVGAGGFDETFRFFLEDTDMSLRLASDGARLAVAPLAQVHHGFAPSSRRTRLRAPLDLFDIGRSTSFFLLKHRGGATDEFWLRLERREQRRLVKHMLEGTCEPMDVARRLQRLRAGWEEGARLTPKTPPAVNTDPPKFAPCPILRGRHQVFASRWISRRASLIKQAKNAVAVGNRASVFSFSLTPFRHRVRYLDAGIWLQTGGVFGKSDRSDPAFRWCRYTKRLHREITCVANLRGIGDN